MVVNDAFDDRESTLPSKNSRCLYDADGAYWGTTVITLEKCHACLD